MDSQFSHIDQKGNVKMVDVTQKDTTYRVAIATGEIKMTELTFNKILDNSITKGNVLETARIAGIMATKKTGDLIPMCHPLNITHSQIDFFPEKSKNTIKIKAKVSVLGQTGVEMEALTAVCLSALTIYDMCKSVDKNMTILNIKLCEKSGGKSGTFIRNDEI